MQPIFYQNPITPVAYIRRLSGSDEKLSTKVSKQSHLSYPVEQMFAFVSTPHSTEETNTKNQIKKAYFDNHDDKNCKKDAVDFTLTALKSLNGMKQTSLTQPLCPFPHCDVNHCAIPTKCSLYIKQ